MVEHRMRMAFLGQATAKRRGLNKNHHARVWCDCMDCPVYPPGAFGFNPNDSRRLGSFDALGVVDLRVPFAGLELWRKHVLEAQEGGD